MFTGSAGRPLPGAWGNPRPPGGGKSGLHRAMWWVTPTTRRRLGSLAFPAAEGSGQCNRKDTARQLSGRRVRVKWWGGLPLNVRAHQQPGDRLAWQTPHGARPSKGGGSARPVSLPGRLLERAGDRAPREMVVIHAPRAWKQNPAYRPARCFQFNGVPGMSRFLRHGPGAGPGNRWYRPWRGAVRARAR